MKRGVIGVAIACAAAVAGSMAGGIVAKAPPDVLREPLECGDGLMSTGESNTHGAVYLSAEAAFQAEVPAVQDSTSAFLSDVEMDGRSAGRVLTAADQQLLREMLRPSLEFGMSGEWKTDKTSDHVSFGLFGTAGERARIDISRVEGGFATERTSICGEHIAVDFGEVDRLLGNDTTEVSR